MQVTLKVQATSKAKTGFYGKTIETERREYASDYENIAEVVKSHPAGTAYFGFTHAEHDVFVTCDGGYTDGYPDDEEFHFWFELFGKTFRVELPTFTDKHDLIHFDQTRKALIQAYDSEGEAEDDENSTDISVKFSVEGDRYLKDPKRQPIYTISVTDLEDEEDVTPMNLSGTYYIGDEAIAEAKKYADRTAGDKRVLDIKVFTGEYENVDTGDIFGEPEAAFSATNASKQDYAAAREKLHYVQHTADYYGDWAHEVLN